MMVLFSVQYFQFLWIFFLHFFTIVIYFLFNFCRKLKNTIEEYTTRVGQQAVVLCCTPGKPNQLTQAFKVFGSQPLENVVSGEESIDIDLL